MFYHVIVTSCTDLMLMRIPSLGHKPYYQRFKAVTLGLESNKGNGVRGPPIRLGITRKVNLPFTFLDSFLPFYEHHFGNGVRVNLTLGIIRPIAAAGRPAA